MRYLVLKSALTGKWVIVPKGDPRIVDGQYWGSGRTEYPTREKARNVLRPLAIALAAAA